MALDTLKFKDADFTGKDIASLPDTPSASGITAQQLKERFDQIPKMMLALGNYNRLIDALMERGAIGGAESIGVKNIVDMQSLTVQDALEELLGKFGEVAPKFETDATLKLEEGVLSVNTATDIEEDNTLPVTAAAVYQTVGNIEVLLSKL